MKDKKYYIIGFGLVMLLVAIAITASYAYFTATVHNDGDENPTVITTGLMELLFSDGQDVSASNLMPGDSVTKTFKVKNIGDVDTVYDIYLSEVINNFYDKSELEYKIIGQCAADNNYHQAPETTGNESKIISSCPIQVNEEFEYELEIKFIETNDAQDYNKGKTFSAKIGINEYNTYNMTVNLHSSKTTLATNTFSVNLGEELSDLPEIQAPEGYTFDGWYDNEEYEGSVITSSSRATYDMSNLYAKFVPVEYTITYNYGVGSATNPTTYTIETEDFTLNNPTSGSASFQGWTGSNGTTKQTTVTITKGTTGNKTYSAAWLYDTINMLWTPQNGNLGTRVSYVNAQGVRESYTFNAYANKTFTVAKGTKFYVIGYTQWCVTAPLDSSSFAYQTLKNGHSFPVWTNSTYNNVYFYVPNSSCGVWLHYKGQFYGYASNGYSACTFKVYEGTENL